MNRSSIFKIKIDFQKSQGSYLMDKDTREKYLDFFGQYATLTLGYNHPIFKTKEYLDEIISVAHQKITNCEMLSDESVEFDELFRSFTSKDIFTHYHYSCTGALAIEAAVKTAIQSPKQPQTVQEHIALFKTYPDDDGGYDAEVHSLLHRTRYHRTHGKRG